MCSLSCAFLLHFFSSGFAPHLISMLNVHLIYSHNMHQFIYSSNHCISCIFSFFSCIIFFQFMNQFIKVTKKLISFCLRESIHHVKIYLFSDCCGTTVHLSFVHSVPIILFLWNTLLSHHHHFFFWSVFPILPSYLLTPLSHKTFHLFNLLTYFPSIHILINFFPLSFEFFSGRLSPTFIISIFFSF